MARRFAGRGRSLPAPKRQIANDGVDASSAVSVAMGAVAQVKFSVGSFEVVEPALTLVRTRGSLIIAITTSGSANNIINAAFGIIVVSNEAQAAGIASLPGPLSEIENDWVVYVPICMHADLVATNPNDLGAVARLDFDSRGMRKMKLGETLAFVLEVAQGNATTGTQIDFATQIRNQFKL